MTNDLTKYIDLSAIDQADLKPETKKRYKQTLQAYLDKGGKLTDPDMLASYASTLPMSTRFFLKAAVRLVTNGIVDNLKAQANPENVQAIQAVRMRVDAIQDAIKTHRPKGQLLHIWLSEDEVQALMDTCNVDEPDGLRDYILLGLLVGAALRRKEALDLTFDQVVQVPNGHGKRDVIRIRGKGDKDRAMPINRKLADAIRRWQDMIDARGDSKVLRSLTPGLPVGDDLSLSGLWKAVKRHGAEIGFPDLSCHDLRRTYAKIAVDHGVPLDQLQKLMGHASMETTIRYLPPAVDFDKTPSDFVPM
jgi:integrase